MNKEKKRLLIGTDDFRKLIVNERYFVDKTLLIQEFIDSAYDINIVIRPRRFGKSLNLSMLRYYFDIGIDNTKALFENFLVAKSNPIYQQHQGQYPVIFLSLKGIKADNYQDALSQFRQTIVEVYRQHSYLLDSTRLSDAQRHQIEHIIYEKVNLEKYQSGLKFLCEILHTHYQRKIIILLDEYDTPIHAAYQYDYYDKMIAFMRVFMGETFKSNIYLHKAMITGILRIAKESIFSDLNNPGIFTILSYQYGDKFGFTTAETQQILTDFDYKEDFEKVKAWYDGYHFGKTPHLYNPWSITNYVARQAEGLKPHWVNTSSDILIKTQVAKKDANELRTDIGKLLQGQSIIKRVEENIIFSDLDFDEEVLWSLLLFAGYLTIDKQIDLKTYQLRIPNLEIRTLFKDLISNWLKRGVRVKESLLWQMTQHLVNNKIPQFEKAFKRIMGDTLSYFDVNTEPERVYQAYVLGMLSMLDERYILKSNRESGEGRYDILILPTQKNLYGIIIELKTLPKTAKKETIKKELADALSQIQNNQYYKELETHQITQRVELAIVFAGKQVHLKAKE